MSTRRFVPLALAAAALLSSHAAPTPEPTAREGEWKSIEWLAGAWESRADGAIAEEHWTPLAGGTMLGVNRTISGERTVAFEFLRIEERPDGIVYVAHPGARSPGTEFVLTHHDAHEVVFENPEHDFPTMIRYRKQKDGSMVATIGGGETGEDGQMSFPYRRPEATDDASKD